MGYFAHFFIITQLLQLAAHGHTGQFAFGQFIYQADMVTAQF